MSAWDKMILGVAVVYLLFKALTTRRLAFGRALGYWALWPGIDEPPALGARRQSFLIDFRIQSDAHQEDSRP